MNNGKRGEIGEGKREREGGRGKMERGGKREREGGLKRPISLNIFLHGVSLSGPEKREG